MAGGQLSGLAAQWRVEAGSGAAVGFSDALHYELWLPLSVNAESRVEALIEAIGADGRPIVLAMRQAHPWTIGRRPDAAAGRLTNGPSNTPSLASEIVAAPQGVLVASATVAALERTRFAQTPKQRARAVALGSADARGPPRAG